MPNLTLTKASDYLNISKKYLENYAKVGKELPLHKEGRSYVITDAELNEWKAQREYSMVQLIREDYLKCLEFAIRSFYQYKSTSNFGTTEQREAGKFVSNFVIGKLGEIAVTKFIKRHYDIDITLDFSLRDAVVGQDIVEIAKPRRGGRVYNPARKRIAIKTTKMKNVWLIVPQKEIEDTTRVSEIYICSRVELFLNHFIRIVRDHNSLNHLTDIIPQFDVIEAQVCGYIPVDLLRSNAPVKILPDQDQAIGSSYVYRTGMLMQKKDDWDKLIEEL
ncbi:helix-turn-helix domain-containing protein [candidate division TA06 bacterium]|nr:helix-turn-helix domain-containing protein [candidate division TA06 bacterium]